MNISDKDGPLSTNIIIVQWLCMKISNVKKFLCGMHGAVIQTGHVWVKAPWSNDTVNRDRTIPRKIISIESDSESSPSSQRSLHNIINLLISLCCFHFLIFEGWNAEKGSDKSVIRRGGGWTSLLFSLVKLYPTRPTTSSGVFIKQVTSRNRPQPAATSRNQL